jgi:WD40 repeat protein/predicted Ser/Thr protein kinase
MHDQTSGDASSVSTSPDDTGSPRVPPPGAPGLALAERLQRLWRDGKRPDVHDFLVNEHESPQGQLFEALLVDQRERWQRGIRASLEEYLERQPWLRGDDERLLELVRAEWDLRHELGEAPRVDTYRERFPRLAARLEPLFAEAVFERSTRRHEPGSDWASDDLPGEDTDPSADTIAPVAAGDARDAATLPASEAPQRIGPRLPRIAGYEVLGLLGRGGMGVVYKARHQDLKRVVALKMISSGAHAGPVEAERFRVEAESVARLQHANIVQIHEVGRFRGKPFISLEYVEGGTLGERLADEVMPARKAAELVATLAEAMQYAHARGIVHRDLKPGNILLTSDGTPKITDFGLAKRLDDDSGQTRSGAVLGTLLYMSAEQAEGRRDVGPATDVYALGAILFHILAGRPPFRGETEAEVLDMVRFRDPPSLSRLQPGVPRDLETICLKCLQKSPERRYASSSELAADLRRWLTGEPIIARPVGRLERAVKWIKRRPARASLIGVSVLATAALFAVGWIYNARLEDANARLRDALTLSEERLERSRRGQYALQLGRVEELSVTDPARGLELLHDAQRCPDDLRDFAWRLLARRCQRDRLNLVGHGDGARCVAVSSAGRWMATGAGDGSARLWDAATGQLLATLAGDGGAVHGLAFHPTEPILATASADGVARLWQLPTGTLLGSLAGHTDSIHCLAFAPDGQTLASGGADQTVRLWDMTTRTMRDSFTDLSGSVFGLAYSPDGRWLAIAGRDATVRLWDVTGDDPPSMLEGHRGAVTCVAFSPDGLSLASGSVDRTVIVWDAATLATRTALRGHAGVVGSVAFAPDGESLASAGYDRTAIVWNLATAQPRTILRGQDERLTGVVYSREGAELVTSSLDGSATVWELAVSGPDELRAHERPVAALAVAADSRKLFTAGYGDGVVVSDLTDRPPLDTGEVRASAALFGADDSIRCLAADPRGSFLAAGDGHGNLRVWETPGNSPRFTAAAHQLWVSAVAVSGDGQLIATAGGEDSRVRLWNAGTGAALRSLDGHEGEITAIAFQPGGSTLAVGLGDGSIHPWNVTTAERSRVISGQDAAVRCLAFAPDGESLAAGYFDGSARIWDMAHDRPPVDLLGHAGSVKAIAFAPDGRDVATGGADRTIRIWDPVLGQERLKLAAREGDVNCLAFTPDGAALVSGADTLVTSWRSESPTVEKRP